MGCFADLQEQAYADFYRPKSTVPANEDIPVIPDHLPSSESARSDEDAIADAVKRIGADMERLTRRNMKEAVCEHIQTLCRQDAAFARRTMTPCKSMINCFKYINRKAREYAEQEMADNGVERNGVYGLDVPDDLCCQWAEDYFNDPDVKEDHKDDEKFVPKPYVPAGRKTSKSKTTKKKSEAEKADTEKSADDGIEQLTLGGM